MLPVKRGWKFDYLGQDKVDCGVAFLNCPALQHMNVEVQALMQLISPRTCLALKSRSSG